MVAIPQVRQRGRDWGSMEKIQDYGQGRQPFLQHSVVLIQQHATA